MGMIHEIGHTLGLVHTHQTGNIPAGYDNSMYSVMSYVDVNYLYRYFTPTGGGGLQANYSEVYVTTPGVFDIAAIQKMYGADPNTASGDTVYVFDENAPFYQTIYDAGGVDTIDLSSHTRGSNLNLTPGSVGDVAGYTVQDQINDAIAK